MLEQVLRYIKNWFAIPGRERIGTFEVQNGTINAPFLLDGQYFRVRGSVFNDGVYKNPAVGLTDESFYGIVIPLAIPQEVITLAEEIAGWDAKNASAAAGVYQSESFGGYSYTLKSGDKNESASWQSAFAHRLNRWRKL